jgi:hypothetical protein
MGHQVRTHTRRLPSGRTVTVRHHARDDDGAAPADAPLDEKDQEHRDRFERRVQRERQAAERRALREQHEREKSVLQQRQGGRPAGGGPAKSPGERRGRASRGTARAWKHFRKAARSWRRHKVRAVAWGALAVAEFTVAGTARAFRAARNAVRKARKRKRGRRK